MTTITASEARANLYRLIDQTAASHQPVHIAGKRSGAVLLSVEDWEAIQETLHLLAVPGRYYIAHAAVAALAAEGRMNAKDVVRAIREYRIDPERSNPIGS